MTKRQRVTDYIVAGYAGIIPGDDYNPSVARARLEAMSDSEFDVYIRSLANPEKNGGTAEEIANREILPFVSPPLGKEKITMDNLIALAEKLGIPLFERLWITDPQSGVTYLTPNKYPVFFQLVRRQAQMLTKKYSIPEDTRHVDEMSGQVTGKSKGSKISFPEVQAQLAQGLEATLIEEMKLRGGDQVAFKELDRQLIEHGEASIDDVTDGTTMTTATSNLAILLRGMMLDNDIDEV